MEANPKRQGMSTAQLAILWYAVVIIGFFIVGCRHSGNDDCKMSEIPASDFEVFDLRIQWTSGLTHSLSGRLTNNSDKAVHRITMEVLVYNSSGKLIDTGSFQTADRLDAYGSLHSLHISPGDTGYFSGVVFGVVPDRDYSVWPPKFSGWRYCNVRAYTGRPS